MIDKVKKGSHFFVWILVVACNMACSTDRAATTGRAAALKDTSFTLHNAYLKELKKYPFIKIADPKVSEKIAVRSVSYKSVSARRLGADIYLPENKGKCPAVLLVHGGGWKSGDKSQMSAMAKVLANNGFIAMAVEYRLSPEAKYPAALEDLNDAVTWLSRNHDKYPIDTSKVAILGVSAGGQLAALLGTSRTSGLTIKAIVDIDGILAFHHPESAEGQVAAEWLGGSYEEKPEAWIAASPLTHAGQYTPPILFINSQHPRFHAGRDDLIKRISPFGIQAEIHTLKDTPHTFWLFDPWFEPTMGYVNAFLNKTLKYDSGKV